MKDFLRFAVITILVAGLVGCKPRGETKTLAEVLAAAQARYADASKAEVPSEVAGMLDKVNADLQALISSDDLTGATDKLAAIGEAIAALVSKAGFTSRTALSEVAVQYRTLSGASGETLTAAQVKLLASRTYAILAAELETTKFGLTE